MSTEWEKNTEKLPETRIQPVGLTKPNSPPNLAQEVHLSTCDNYEMTWTWAMKCWSVIFLICCTWPKTENRSTTASSRVDARCDVSAMAQHERVANACCGRHGAFDEYCCAVDTGPRRSSRCSLDNFLLWYSRHAGRWPGRRPRYNETFYFPNSEN